MVDCGVKLNQHAERETPIPTRFIQVQDSYPYQLLNVTTGLGLGRTIDEYAAVHIARLELPSLQSPLIMGNVNGMHPVCYRNNFIDSRHKLHVVLDSKAEHAVCSTTSREGPFVAESCIFPPAAGGAMALHRDFAELNLLIISTVLEFGAILPQFSQRAPTSKE